GRGGAGARRAPTWEISDSDTEGPAVSEAAARARDPVEERRTAAQVLRPERSPKRLVVRLDPAILEDAGADVLLQALDALGCEQHIEPQPLPRSISWSPINPDPFHCGVPAEVWAEQELLLLLEPEEFLQGVAQLTQVSGPACSMPWLCPESPGCTHLAVIGLDAHLWRAKLMDVGAKVVSLPRSGLSGVQERQQRSSASVVMAHAEGAVGWPQVEETLVFLQLWAGLDVLLVASWQELSKHVCAVTRAIAQRPFKWLRDSQTFSFCTAGRWAAGDRVARDGRGLRRIWWRQIQQFNRVSPQVANAVVTAFPSPRLLQQAYEACGSEQERLGLLADLPVEGGQSGRPRRVGPDLSRRLFLFLTSCHPDLMLDLSS
ncbi:PREDICTED: probable crossover junction endonuclease EME2, partial [Chrysochloris asiatica]|uniref:Structure-specific endonuclease subunit EME2 n=1 Tax=Chrysochloris asiatica TaxID=185453 RepID=A0A9B0WZ46_CHRAS